MESQFIQKMKFAEPKSFHDAMSPVSRTCWIFGVGILEYPIGRRRPLLSFCWSIAHLTMYLLCIGLAELPSAPGAQRSVVASNNYYLSSCCDTVFMIASMTLAWKTKTLTRWSRLINAVNENLKQFGISEDFGITFKYQCMQLAVCFLQFIVILVITFSSMRVHGLQDVPNLAFWISALHQLMFTHVVGCAYCGLVRYLGNRFQHLNAYLLQSSPTETKPFRQNLNHQEPTDLPIIRTTDRHLRSEDRRWTVHVLREARSVHRDLCLIVKTMNHVFGIQIVFFIGISFCCITSLLFDIYLVSATPALMSTSLEIGKLMPSCCWLVAYLTAVYYIIYCCSIVSYEAQQTGILIHERIKPDSSTDMQAEIDAFSLQLIQNPLQFTAHGFFILDYKLIRGIAGTVTTYLVIMIQLRGIYDSKNTMNWILNSTNYQNFSA